MASATEIANNAAVLIGTQARILSLDDDRMLARTLRTVWDAQRQATLRDGAWNFGSRRAQLAAASSPGVIYPYTYAYPMPAESLKLIEVLGMSRSCYQYEGSSILCDQSGPLNVRYAIDVPELAKWDALAAEAFACRLAWKCGRRIAGSAYSVDRGEAEYQAAIAKAKAHDALENPPIEPEESSWNLARLASGGGGWAVPGGGRW